MARKPFVVLDAEILSSSVWSEAAHVRLVWITLLILCDTEGNVGAAVPGIARAAGVTLDEAVDAIRRLQEPDPHSRTKAHEGRRLEISDRGFRVLNFMEHLDRLSSERLRARERVRMHRKRHSDKRKTRKTVTQTNTSEQIRTGSRDQGVGNREQGIENNGALSIHPSQESVTDYELEPCNSSKGKPELSEDERAEYKRAVLEAFRLKAGFSETRFVPPADFTTVTGWLDEGIPLRVVLTAIEETKRPPQQLRLLAYFGSSVRAEYERQQLAVSGTR